MKHRRVTASVFKFSGLSFGGFFSFCGEEHLHFFSGIVIAETTYATLQSVGWYLRIPQHFSWDPSDGTLMSAAVQDSAAGQRGFRVRGSSCRLRQGPQAGDRPPKWGGGDPGLCVVVCDGTRLCFQLDACWEA